MSTIMTLERAAAFGAAWNSRDPDYVASFFAEDGVYHASVGPDLLGKTYRGKDQIRDGARVFFERFPDAQVVIAFAWLPSFSRQEIPPLWKAQIIHGRKELVSWYAYCLVVFCSLKKSKQPHPSLTKTLIEILNVDWQ